MTFLRIYIFEISVPGVRIVGARNSKYLGSVAELTSKQVPGNLKKTLPFNPDV